MYLSWQSPTVVTSSLAFCTTLVSR